MRVRTEQNPSVLTDPDETTPVCTFGHEGRNKIAVRLSGSRNLEAHRSFYADASVSWKRP